MFARRRQIQLVKAHPPTPQREAHPGDIPSLKSVSRIYVDQTDRLAQLRKAAETLRSDLVTADAEGRFQIESELAVNTREQQAANDLLRNEVVEASTEICKRIAPHYRGLVDRMARATIELHQANLEYTSYAAKLDRSGIRWSRLKPAFPLFAGGPRDRTSPLANFLRQLVADGFLDRTDLPKEFGGGERR